MGGVLFQKDEEPRGWENNRDGLRTTRLPQIVEFFQRCADQNKSGSPGRAA